MFTADLCDTDNEFGTTRLSYSLGIERTGPKTFINRVAEKALFETAIAPLH